MAKKAITEVESKAKKILADRATEVADIEERIETVKQHRDVALDAMNKATDAGDVTAYQQAKADFRSSEDALEMYKKRLDALEDKPLIAKGEYEKGVAQIMSALGEVSADAKKQIVSHMEQIRILAADVNAEIAKGNEVLHKWQHEVFKDKAELQRMDGSKVHIDTKERQYKDFSVSQFADYVLTSGHYGTICGRNK